MDDYEHMDEYYDEFDQTDENLSQIEKDHLILRAIGDSLLDDADEDDLDNMNYLYELYDRYSVSAKKLMRYASDRIVDMYDVGEVYLTPLFHEQYDKECYIMRKLREFDNATDGATLKYDEENILINVYHTPKKYAKFVVKFMYTKDEHETVPFAQRIRNIFNSIKQKINGLRSMKDEDVEHFKVLYNDVLNGARCKNLRWLIADNQQAAKAYTDELLGDPVCNNDMSYFAAGENLEITYYVLAIHKILKKEKLTLADKENLETYFGNLNHLVILASNRYKAQTDLDNANNREI